MEKTGAIPVELGVIVNHPLLRYVFPFWLLTVAFTVLVVILPHGKVYFRFAVMGGAFFATLFEIAKNLFTHYLLTVSRVSLVYGSFGSLIVVVLWVFYLSVIFIYSAEFVSVTQKMAEEKRWRRSLTDLRGKIPDAGEGR